MSEETERPDTAARLRTYHQSAHKHVKILCPLLSAMRGYYQDTGVLNDNLADHVEELMNKLYNDHMSMETLLQKDDIPF